VASLGEDASALRTQGSPVLQRRRLGSELRRLREAAGVTIDEVAAHLYCSHSKISRIETARVSATVRDVRDMLDLYGVSESQREVLLELAQASRQKAWWHAYSDLPDVRTYLGLEEAAASIHMYESLLVPGLLQVEEYARTAIATLHPELHSEDIERHVRIRMTRQEMFTKDDPRILYVVLDEAVLHRIVGNRGIMRQQLNYLTKTTDLPNVTLQILPFTAGQHAGLSGTFTIFAFPESTDLDVIYIEHSAGALYLDNADQMQRYRGTFDRLRAAALAPNDSNTLIAKMLEGL
jgi:transcriptional regulator with XRE-family HTH domain